MMFEELGLRFIGSKAALLPFIEENIRKICGTEQSRFGDLFCGTAVVSRHFKKLGYEVIANDNLAFCATSAKAVLLNNHEPSFSNLISSRELKNVQVGKLLATPYDFVLSFLDRITPEPNFIYNEYSPGGTARSRYKRQYFSDANAQKIDAIRGKIAEWQKNQLINEEEASLLIYDLIRATNKIANIAGTYGYFMKEWDARARKPLTLMRSTIVESKKRHEVYQNDANKVAKKLRCEILYLDPPYTWRHYGAYYHLLETIAKWDRPQVSGNSGLRPWQDTKSRYCMRDQASDALQDLVRSANADHIFLSYNNEGLISHKRILSILSERGTPDVIEMKHRKYKSNGIMTEQNVVVERLYHITGRQ